MFNKEYPLVILTGHRKSGTSLFHRLFDGHSGVFLYPLEFSILYAYFPCYTKKINLSEDDLRKRILHVVNKSIDILLRQNFNAINKSKYLDILKGKIKEINLLDKGEVITAICGAWLEYNESNYSLPLIIKETSQAVFFETYRKKFPQMKMISVIRDPRDNFSAISAGVNAHYSKLGEGHDDALSSLINRAKMDLIAAKINTQKYPNSFLAIRFEDLVNNTKDIMSEVANFLNIEFDNTLLNPMVGNDKYKGNNYDGNIFSGISDKNIGNWKNRISSRDAKIIEYWMSDIMKYWKYESEYDITSSQIEFSKFYEIYNCKYFYHDSFSDKKGYW